MKRLFEPETYRSDCASYWNAVADARPHQPGLEGDLETECIIIGAGYTGLNAALELKERYGLEATVIDAEQPGWGASGRNGGFCCLGGTKLSWLQQIKRYGETETRRFFEEQVAAVETVRLNLERYGIDARTHSDGETCLAHHVKAAESLEEEGQFLRAFFGVAANFIPTAALSERGLASAGFHGALNVPQGFAIDPMAYVSGLHAAVGAAGIRVFGGTPALNIKRTSGRFHVRTPNGTIFAKRLLVATNGYSSEDIPEWLGGRLLPALSNIMVTRPLTEAEVEQQGWTSHQMCYDSRRLLHYFRLMPPRSGEGPRMLFGMRGGTSGAKRHELQMHKRLRADFDHLFPSWREVETDFAWSGLVCLTRDLTCYLGPLDRWENAWAALAWHGNGVAMGSHAGRMVASLIAGRRTPEELPAIMREQPKRFPLAGLRRFYLALAYRLFDFLDDR